MLNKKLGKIGEIIAANFLRDTKDYRIIETNFRNSQGEIDLICKKEGAIIFIEVKTRTSTRFGYPEEAIGDKKLARIEQVANDYCENIHHTGPWRIEAVSIIINKNKKSLGIKHLTNI